MNEAGWPWMATVNAFLTMKPLQFRGVRAVNAMGLIPRVPVVLNHEVVFGNSVRPVKNLSTIDGAATATQDLSPF
jgi:hypothetical protein